MEFTFAISLAGVEVEFNFAIYEKTDLFDILLKTNKKTRQALSTCLVFLIECSSFTVRQGAY